MSADFDLQPHLDAWHRFIRMVFYGAGFVVTVLVLLAIFLL